MKEAAPRPKFGPFVTTAQLLARLRDRGLDLKPYRIDYMIRAGIIDPPTKNYMKHRLFTPKDVDDIERIEKARREGTFEGEQS